MTTSIDSRLKAWPCLLRASWRRVLWMRWTVEPAAVTARWPARLAGDAVVPTGAVWVVIGDRLRRPRSTAGHGPARSAGGGVAVIAGGTWRDRPLAWVVDLRGLGGLRHRRARAVGLPSRRSSVAVTRDARGYVHCLARGDEADGGSMAVAVKYRPLGGAGVDGPGPRVARPVRLAWSGSGAGGVWLDAAFDVSGERSADIEIHACDLSGVLGVRLDEAGASVGWVDRAAWRSGS